VSAAARLNSTAAWPVPRTRVAAASTLLAAAMQVASTAMQLASPCVATASSTWACWVAANSKINVHP
jgi:hypothetical protein